MLLPTSTLYYWISLSWLFIYFLTIDSSYLFFLKALGKFAFQIMNGVGDYITLEGVLNPKTLPDWSKMSDSEILTKVS